MLYVYLFVTSLQTRCCGHNVVYLYVYVQTGVCGQCCMSVCIGSIQTQCTVSVVTMYNNYVSVCGWFADSVRGVCGHNVHACKLV